MNLDQVIIVPEKKVDYRDIKLLTNLAFEREDESNLIKALRETHAYIPSLALVAKYKGINIGYVLFTEITIDGHTALAMAPIAVHPQYQGYRVGGKLIREGVQKAFDLGYGVITVLGSNHYYPKFGFERASKYGIRCPFYVEDKYFMVYGKDDALNKISGVVKYAEPFLNN